MGKLKQAIKAFINLKSFKYYPEKHVITIAYDSSELKRNKNVIKQFARYRYEYTGGCIDTAKNIKWERYQQRTKW